MEVFLVLFFWDGGDVGEGEEEGEGALGGFRVLGFLKGFQVFRGSFFQGFQVFLFFWSLC